MGSVILVGEVAARTRMLDIVCARCPRRGRLSLRRLLAEFGPAAPIHRAWDELGDDCPMRGSASPYSRCNLSAPELSALF